MYDPTDLKQRAAAADAEIIRTCTPPELRGLADVLIREGLKSDDALPIIRKRYRELHPELPVPGNAPKLADIDGADIVRCIGADGNV